MRRLILVVWSLFCVVVIFVASFYLTKLFLAMPFDMPFLVDVFIRFGFKVFVGEDMPAPEDMAVIAIIIYCLCAIAITGCFVGIAGKLLWRRLISPRWR